MTSDVKSSTIPNDSISKSRSNISSATVSFNGIQLTHNDFYNNFVDLFHTFPELCPLDKPKVSDLLQMPDGSRRSSNTSALWYIAKDIINHKTSSTRLTFRKDGDFSSSPILMIRNKDNFISYTFIHGTIFHDIIFIDGVLNSIENSRCGTNFCKDNKESLSIIVSSRESCEVFVRYCRSPPNEIVIDTWISRDLITSENITSFILTRDELERVFKNKMTTYLFVNKIKITHIVYRESGIVGVADNAINPETPTLLLVTLEFVRLASIEQVQEYTPVVNGENAVPVDPVATFQPELARTIKGAGVRSIVEV